MWGVAGVQFLPDTRLIIRHGINGIPDRQMPLLRNSILKIRKRFIFPFPFGLGADTSLGGGLEGESDYGKEDSRQEG